MSGTYKKCKSCGKIVLQDSVFCEYCGSNDIENCVETTSIKRVFKKCTDCKNDVPNDSKFCPYCGGVNLIDYELEEKQLIIKQCEKCKKQLPLDSEYCQYCGSDSVIEKAFAISSLDDSKSIIMKQNTHSYKKQPNEIIKNIKEAIHKFLNKKWKRRVVLAIVLIVLLFFGFKFYAKNIAILNQKYSNTFHLNQNGYLSYDKKTTVTLWTNYPTSIKYTVYGIGVSCDYVGNNYNRTIHYLKINRSSIGFAVIVFENVYTNETIKLYVGN